MLRIAARSAGSLVRRSAAPTAPVRSMALTGGGGDSGFSDAMFRAFRGGGAEEEEVETIDLRSAVQIQIEDAKEEEATGPFPFDEFPTSLAFDLFEGEESTRVDMERSTDGGAEKIHVGFSIDDIADPLPGLTEDEEEGEAEPGVNFTVRVSRKGHKSLLFECAAYRQGLLLRDMAMANVDENNESVDDGEYTGPKLMDMDEPFTRACLGYLAERGIDQQLALFVCEYSNYLESKHYQRWLGNLHRFLE